MFQNKELRDKLIWMVEDLPSCSCMDEAIIILEMVNLNQNLDSFVRDLEDAYKDSTCGVCSDDLWDEFAQENGI